MPKQNISYGKKEHNIRTRIQITEANGKTKNIGSRTIYGINGFVVLELLDSLLERTFGVKN